MTKTIINIKLRFTEPLLGTCCNNPQVHEEFIASKAPTIEAAKEEVEAIDPETAMQKAMTVFPKDDTGLFLWDYMLRGAIKESLGVLIELGDVKGGLSKWTFKKTVDSLVFVTPRRCYLMDKDGAVIKETTDHLTRPLRADTMRGERVALTTSEQLPIGTQIAFTITLLEGSNPKARSIKEADIRAALEYGALKGIGQWRSGGFGRFEIVA